LEKKDQIIFADILDIKYGYIIFEKNRQRKLNRIKSFLRNNGILVAGRFGEWEYYNMDHAILSGKKAAKEIKSKSTSKN
jgi:UDP-galactopyranose mutase